MQPRQELDDVNDGRRRPSVVSCRGLVLDCLSRAEIVGFEAEACDMADGNLIYAVTPLIWRASCQVQSRDAEDLSAEDPSSEDPSLKSSHRMSGTGRTPYPIHLEIFVLKAARTE